MKYFIVVLVLIQIGVTIYLYDLAQAVQPEDPGFILTQVISILTIELLSIGVLLISVFVYLHELKRRNRKISPNYIQLVFWLSMFSLLSIFLSVLDILDGMGTVFKSQDYAALASLLMLLISTLTTLRYIKK